MIKLLLLGGAMLAAAPVDSGLERAAAAGSSAALQAPVFAAGLTRGRLVLRGTSGSAAHEAAFASIVTEQFVYRDAQVSLAPGVLVSDAWVAASTHLLHVLAATEPGFAVMHDRAVIVRGITADAPTFSARLASVRRALPATTIVESDVIFISNEARLPALCRRTFEELAADPVAFRRSSAELSTSAYATLDKIVEFLADCRDATITIVGHGDAAGDADWNVHLSEARAGAVASYLAGRGIAAGRRVVEGRGASEPIDGNGTAYGRSRNRRIEFELRQGLL